MLPQILVLLDFAAGAPSIPAEVGTQAAYSGTFKSQAASGAFASAASTSGFYNAAEHAGTFKRSES